MAKTTRLAAGRARPKRAGKDTLQESVYERLKLALLRGRVTPGSILTIRSLAANLGTSPMPVREALLRLESQGALEMLSNRSIRVPLKSAERFFELCDVRALIEGEAASQAATNATDLDLEEMTSWNRKFDLAIQASKASQALECNERFHFALYGASRNVTLMWLIEYLWMQCGPYISALFDYYAIVVEASPGDLAGGFGHHAAITAVRNKDSAAARRAIRRDIAASVDSYRRLARHLGAGTPTIEGRTIATLESAR